MGHFLIQFLCAQAWCGLLIISFFGWGNLVLRGLALQNSSIGLAACAGLSVAVLFGGILNLFHFINEGTLIAFSLLGVLLAVEQMIRQADAKPKEEVRALRLVWQWSWVAALCLIFLFLFRVTTTVRTVYLPQDDENFYLAVPVKMLQVHSLAADPFSERRIETSLGGSYFLQCLVTSVLPLQNVQMADEFFGFVLIVLLVLALANQLELTPLEIAGAVFLAACLRQFDQNLTFTVLPSAYLLAMVLMATQRGQFVQRPNVQALQVGILAGTLCTLKSTYLPFALLFCFSVCPQLGPKIDWKSAWMRWSFALLGALLVMLPWMAAMHETCGTYLYPVLGQGYTFSAYHQFPIPFTAEPFWVFQAGARSFLPLALIIFAQLFLFRRESSNMIFLTTTSACLVSSIATGFATGGDDNQRYIYPLVMPTLLLGYLQFSRERRLRADLKLGPFLQVASIVLVLTSLRFHWRYTFEMMFSDKPMDSPEISKEYAAINAALPKDGLILTTVQKSYLLEPLNDRILLAEYPGCAGLPPGWPIKQDGEALSEYLLNHSIRYLAYSYSNNALLDICISPTLYYPHQSVRTQIQFGSYLLANKQYLELKQSRRVLYDDGKVFILDLATRASPHS